MRFGIFLAPFHAPGQSPTLALERDLELIQLLDRLGFDEAWIGEHHSAGVELIASPEVFIGVAAERTRNIRLGTGVSSLPYHQPLMLADRMVLLDHLTRGRVMLGVGPGQLVSDAAMMGIPADTQRPRMEEALDAIVHLLTSDEPLTMRTDWFTLENATLQLRPYTQPCFEIAVAASISPTGPRAAGKHGIGMLSVAATAAQGFDALGEHWRVMEERAAEFGTTVDRDRWRLVGPMHIAETREQARADVAFGLETFAEYFSHILPFSPVGPPGKLGDILDFIDESGFAVIGTPHDAIAKIQSLVDQSGGFGAFLNMSHEWADPTATAHSYELMARHVMPHFQGQLERPQASYDWVIGSGGQFVDAATQAIGKAITDHETERSAKGS